MRGHLGYLATEEGEEQVGRKMRKGEGEGKGKAAHESFRWLECLRWQINCSFRACFSSDSLTVM
jgi:hypothetical protein